MKWTEVLERAERNKEKAETTHNTPPSKQHAIENVPQKALGYGTDKTDKRINERAQHRLDRANKLGLIARWSHEFGYISLHDPTTGEWHDIDTKDAPAWAKREAFKRKELRKHHGVYRTLTASEMEEVWEKEQSPMWKHPAITDKGIVYEDYLEEEEGPER